MLYELTEAGRNGSARRSIWMETASLTTALINEAESESNLCPHTRTTASRLIDLCTACAERLAHHTCDACDRRICRPCALFSSVLSQSFFCSSECRDEAELAAEEAR